MPCHDITCIISIHPSIQLSPSVSSPSYSSFPTCFYLMYIDDEFCWCGQLSCTSDISRLFASIVCDSICIVYIRMQACMHVCTRDQIIKQTIKTRNSKLNAISLFCSEPIVFAVQRVFSSLPSLGRISSTSLLDVSALLCAALRCSVSIFFF